MPRKLLVLTVQGGPQPTYGIVNDLSDSGAGIFADRLLPSGRDVRLRICFYPQVCFDTEARVVWGRDGLHANEGEPGLALNGVQFAGPLDLTRLGSNETLATNGHAHRNAVAATILEYLECQIPNYPFSRRLDKAFVEELLADFPNLDILEEIKIFRWFYDSDPMAHVANPRAALRRWISSPTTRGWPGESPSGKGMLLMTRNPNGREDPGDWSDNLQSWVSFLRA